jgi:hypothetical protein
MPKVAITHTSAFELCDGGTCGDAEVGTDKKNVSCRQVDTCGKGGCYCQLFRRAKTAAADDPWSVADLDHHHEAKNEPKEYDYKCLCVLPILETTHSKDGVDYTTRFQFCGLSACSLTRTKTLGVGDDLECSGDCADTKCKCTLFRLSMRAKHDQAKWELAAKGGKKIGPENGYYYPCFCLK